MNFPEFHRLVAMWAHMSKLDCELNFAKWNAIIWDLWKLDESLENTNAEAKTRSYYKKKDK